MLLSYISLKNLINSGVIENVEYEQLNGASIDVRLGDKILIEDMRSANIIDPTKKEAPSMFTATLPYELMPGDFILAHTVEKFNLPNNLALEFKLKSSIARAGLGHLLAGWGDPGWTNSTLTLELKNELQFHPILLKPNMLIGQVVFWHCESVPAAYAYNTRGRYNNQSTVEPSKGV